MPPVPHPRTQPHVPLQNGNMYIYEHIGLCYYASRQSFAMKYGFSGQFDYPAMNHLGFVLLGREC